MTAIAAMGSTALTHNTTWDDFRSEFNMSKHEIHIAQLYLTAHAKRIQTVIDDYRAKLDNNPLTFTRKHHGPNNRKVAEAAAAYLQTSSGEIALTDSTTMGLGILYGGFRLKAGDDILTTTHGHYSHEQSLVFAAKRSNASLRKIDLYGDAATVTVDKIVTTITQAIQPNTRIIAVTYVHSSTGVKLPINQIAAELKRINAKRSADKRIYLCVDAVHGFGIENFTMEEMGCDFLAEGTHKWLFAPRGTGILFGKESAWDMVNPIIPPYSIAFDMWKGQVPQDKVDFFSKITPGGSHSYEYRWALKTAFEWHLEIGKAKIQHRTHELNTLLKDGLLAMPHIKVHTPYSSELSSGMVCFEVEGMTPNEVVKHLRDAHIMGTTTPYRTTYARLTPSIINTEAEIMRCLEVLEKIKD